MNNKLITILMIALMLAACSQHTFKLHTDQFELFKDSATEPNPMIKDFQKGIYLFPLQMDSIYKDGVSFYWYKNLPLKSLLNENAEPVEYAYFVFLDHNRVFYYSSYKDEWKKKAKQIKTKCVQEPCIRPSLPREFSKNKVAALLDSLPGVFDNIRINNRIGNYVLRGYYKLIVENGKTILKMELERPSPKKKIKLKKKGLKISTFNFTFELENEHKLVMDKFEIKRYGQIRSINNVSTIFPSQTLAIQPIFEFVPLKIKLLYRDHNQQDHLINEIKYSATSDSIYYYVDSLSRITEGRINPKYIMSW